jgi:hypothetical protein
VSTKIVVGAPCVPVTYSTSAVESSGMSDAMSAAGA